jgi:hypothetical protein
VTFRDVRRRWKRAPGLLRWTCDDLPGWCVTCTFVPDRKGVYRREFFAQYRNAQVGEVPAGSTVEPVIDALDDLLGLRYRSPTYIRDGHRVAAETD